MAIKAPYLPYDKLRKVADGFLATHHPSRLPPVPIERIIEYDFGMDIVSIPGLRDTFLIDSSISSDLATIYVDEFVFKKRPKRYRFSLAHELSHRLIHAAVFQQLSFTTLTEWTNAIASIPPDQYRWIETQAYNLAGLILVPTEQLEAAYTRADREAAEAGISLRDIDADSKSSVYAEIGDSFDVSADVIAKRLRYEHL